MPTRHLNNSCTAHGSPSLNVAMHVVNWRTMVQLLRCWAQVDSGSCPAGGRHGVRETPAMPSGRPRVAHPDWRTRTVCDRRPAPGVSLSLEHLTVRLCLTGYSVRGQIFSGTWTVFSVRPDDQAPEVLTNPSASFLGSGGGIRERASLACATKRSFVATPRPPGYERGPGGSAVLQSSRDIAEIGD